jgi:hypothetical protein
MRYICIFKSFGIFFGDFPWQLGDIFTNPSGHAAYIGKHVRGRQSVSRAGLPEYSWYNIPKWDKYTRLPTEYNNYTNRL